jgi:methyltransferase (TIGR00027 family)
MPSFQPVASTAFYCCALRAADAATAHPVCGDSFAARFLDDDTLQRIGPLLRFDRPAASNVARHRLIDDLVRSALGEDPTRRIILLGAGFDTRAHRLTGGRWWEVEDPALLAFKESRLPARTARNPLTRIPVSFQTEALATHLSPLAGDDAAVVVLEGVSMYLPDPTLLELATTVRKHLPRATLICDLMSPAFARTAGAGLSHELRRLGAPFADRRKHPRGTIEAAGYRIRQVHSIVGRAREAGTVRIPGWLLDTLLRGLRDGYAVWVFAPAA